MPPLALAQTSQPSTEKKRKWFKLKRGFRWDRNSLAQLYKWRKMNRKGSQACINTDLFPGHTKESLDEVWASRRAEAEQAYDEVWPGRRKHG
jgi:hypothetical protein